MILYNESKVQNRSAVLIHGQGFLGSIQELSVNEKLARFQKRFTLNKRVKTNTLHISLNFSNKDQLDDGLLRFIAKDYMDRIGFGKQPYLVYRHDDAGHPHIHIVSTIIDQNGKRLQTHNLGKGASEKARKEMEESLGLVKAQRQQKDYLIYKPLEKAQYGKAETKAMIENIVTGVMRSYHFESFSAFKAALAQFNVSALKLNASGKKFNGNGLVYFITNQQGKSLSVPIKSSSFFNKPTYAKILKKASFNKDKVDIGKVKAKEDLIQRIIEAQNSACSKGSEKEKLDLFLENLKRKGIYLHLVFNNDGRIYGCTYVDNLQRRVFRGSDLGKAFGENGIIKTFMLTDKVNSKNELLIQKSAQEEAVSKVEKSNTAEDLEVREDANLNPSGLQEILSFFKEHITPDYGTTTAYEPENLKKKRKKNRKDRP
ncbi:relaxase/mobilization nuclease domain-containing protein [Belliella sp. DSM 111904]|uniref:Relaxase/mobilization nuclease domain-containing protein n=1 Tax=Belliella filtrata TaxID=2923435 RepID=A0ABS9V2G1_9BACT|nr:relaxase/mobilization nuclease domain-containing protein [Belliella filtrata]MCH7410563.1 relaxase/mobilization nuclease domain-containing protein [Belliella filtrata]